MANAKRKQDMRYREGSPTDFDEDWSALREIGKTKQKERLNPTPPAGKSGKSPYVDCITTRRVRFDDVKTKYIPIEEKQSVEIMGHMTYEVVYKKVWDYYENRVGISEDAHEMHLITGVFGPKVYSTVQLGTKKDLLVLFTEKTVDEFSINTNIGSATLKKQRIVEPPKKVAKSVIPKIRLKNCDVMAMGRAINTEINWSAATMRSFQHDKTTGSWAWTNSVPVEFHKGSLIGSGAFRNAFKCSIKGMSNLTDEMYVFKQFNKEAVAARIENFKIIGQELQRNEVVKELNQKAVQSQVVAQILANSFGDSLQKYDFDIPRYIQIWLIELGKEDFGTVEEYLEGDFQKHLNNSMTQISSGEDDDVYGKAIALAHFSYVYSAGEYLLTDIQGVDHSFTDPEIATAESYCSEGGKADLLFGAGNLCEAIENFRKTHKCNTYCKLASLDQIE